MDEEKLEMLRARQHSFKKLLENPGWEDLNRSCEEQVRARRNQIFHLELRGLEDAFTLARAQGEISGILMVMVLPKMILDDLKADVLALLEEEKEKENGTGTE